MSFSDEEIIAFLLGDADDGLADRLRSSLASDEELAERVAHFRNVLSHLDSVTEKFEPPADLVENTLARIEASDIQPSRQPPVEDKNEWDEPVSSFLTVAKDSTSSTRSWMDSAALTVSLTVLCCLTIPAILRARFESRRAQCAENLRETGSSLFQYAMLRPDRRFPMVASSGPESFAGVFVIRLRDAGLLPAGRLMPCPSLNGVERLSIATNISVPTLEQFCSASEAQRECLKCTVGSDYAYNLGIYEKGVLEAPQYSGSSHFALLSDAPLFSDKADQLIAHDGKGFNVLFDDGQIRFINSQWLQTGEAGDHPFRNMLGAHEAGVSIMDASLAPSHFPPLSRTLSH
jgi:hypothetical protein